MARLLKKNLVNPFFIITNALVVLLFMLPSRMIAQSTTESTIELQGIATSNNVVPFWIRSNRFGNIPSEGLSLAAVGSIHRNYITDSAKQNNDFDWAFGVRGRANAGEHSNLILIEGYIKAKFRIFEMKAGRSMDIMGLSGDQTLSSGNFAVSGNSLGIPKIELSIPDYYTVPILGGIFSLKGQFAHGWIGKTEVSGEKSRGIFFPVTYFHQKSLYGQIGKKEASFKLFAGFNHQVFWGNEKTVYGKDFKLNQTQSFIYVVTGRAYGNDRIKKSKIGNQIGSIDVAMAYGFKHLNLLLYRQNFYDVGALSKLANIRDGLNGISIEHKEAESTRFSWKKFVVEFLYTKDQAGYPDSKSTKSGDEDYYNNYYYTKGWSYRSLGIGNPFITMKPDAKPGQVISPNDFFVNNRVVALHTGIELGSANWSVKLKLSNSWNYGTFGTSPYGHNTGAIRYPSDGLFKKVDQFSGYGVVERRSMSNYIYGLAVAFDSGGLLNNSIGSEFKIKKTF